MSGGLIFQQAIGLIRSQSLPPVVEKDLVNALDAARPGTSEFSYALGIDADLPRADLLLRGAAIYLMSSASNLADDLADGDVCYLPVRAAPTTQFLLQNLFFQVLARADFPNQIIANAAEDLVASACAQHLEVQTVEWNAQAAIPVAQGLGGRQCSAYLRILWYATRLQHKSVSVGTDLGNIVQIGHDLRTHDPRFFSMSKADRNTVLLWAQEALHRLYLENLPGVNATIRSVEAYFDPETWPKPIT
jgi:hypothetical protein